MKRRDYTLPITIIAVLFIGLVLSVGYGLRSSNRQIRETKKHMQYLQHRCDSITRLYDSLKGEIFVYDIQIGRYEYILNQIDTELDPACKEKVHNITKNVE